MSWVAVVTTAAQAGYGIYQNQKGREMEEEAGERPGYQIPQAAMDALGTAQLRSRQGMDAASKNQMLQEMDRSRMASLSQVTDRRGGLGTVVGLEQAQQDSLRQMAVMDMQKREQNIQALQSQRANMAGYQEKLRADELSVWEQESQAAAAMKGAGIQNIAGAATSMATMLIPQGGADSNIFTGKKREAYKLAGGKEKTGQTFKQFRKEGGYDKFLKENPNFLQQRVVGGDMSQNTGTGTPGVNQAFAPPKINTSNINQSNQNQILNQYLLANQQNFPNIYGNTLQGRLGYNQPFGYNEGMTSNIGLASAMNRQDQLFGGPSPYRQLGGLNLQGGGQNTGYGLNLLKLGF